MSTRANIAIQRKDGTVETVYNHSDGYPEYLGDLLLEHYTNEQDADQTRQMLEMILNLGDISFLDEKLQNSRFYNTWRNEGTSKRVYSTLEEFNNYILDSDRDYVYVWNEETAKWKYARVPYEDNETLEYHILRHSETYVQCNECKRTIHEGYELINSNEGIVEWYCSESCLNKNYTTREQLELAKENKLEYKGENDLYE